MQRITHNKRAQFAAIAAGPTLRSGLWRGRYTRASIMIRCVLPLLLLLSSNIFAAEIKLTQGEKYTVPEGKIWIVTDAQMLTCRACTSDVLISGLSQVEVNGVVFTGYFEFSFTNEFSGPIRLYPGTELKLGESRQELIVQEQDE